LAAFFFFGPIRGVVVRGHEQVGEPR